MNFIRSFTTRWPVCFSLALCLVVLAMSGWLVYVSIRIADEMRGYEMGKCGAEGVPLQKNVTLGLVLLALNVLFSIAYALGFTYWSVKLMRREMVAQAALIKQMEATQEAERKSMSKSIAVANASHEVRNALAGIAGLIQMCRAEVVPRSGLDDNLKHMELCTNDLYSLLNSILDASKIEAGKMQIEEEEFDLQELVEDVADLYYPVGMTKGVDVILDWCDGSVEKYRKVRGDRGKLKQVLGNLVYNAIKFTDEGYVCLRAWVTKPAAEATASASSRRSDNDDDDDDDDDGEIQVEGEKKGNVREYIFDVVDTGKGIPKEKQKSVFENYVQVKETGGNAHQLGHGLGLGIVKSLVRLLGGDIGIVDKELGEKGTCFRFNTFMEIRGGGSESESKLKAEGQPAPRVVLFLHCGERSKIAKRFLESHGIKVSVVNKGYQQLNRTLKRTQQKLFPQSNTASGGSTSSSGSSSPSRSKEVPLSFLDGRDEPAEERSSWNNNVKQHMVLIIIDTSAGPFPEVSGAVAEFLRDFQYGCARVLWIQTLPINNQERLHLPPTHLLISKPLQGSRLHYVLRLLLDFAATSRDSTEVQVVIDKDEEDEEKQKDDDDVPQKKPLSGKSILIVEDHIVLRKLCSAMVSQMGALTHTCNNGEEALHLVSQALHNHPQSPFDYILMDCEMPIMNGFEATRRIKEEGKAMGIWIPIIALTAHTGKEEIQRITEAGMDYYLAKPLQAPNLLTAIQHLEEAREDK